MYTGNYKICNKIFKLNSVFQTIHDLSENYLTNEKFEFEITITKEDIKAYSNSIDGEIYFPTQIEVMLFHERITEILVKYNISIFHGSSIYIDNIDNGFIFTAKSGTGKSTHTALLKELLGDRLTYINGDKPYIEESSNKFYLYGSMFSGKEILESNVKSRLKAIFIVKRSETNKIEKISPSELLIELYKRIYMPKNPEDVARIYTLISNLSKRIVGYNLYCNTSIEAAKLSYSVMEKYIK